MSGRVDGCPCACVRVCLSLSGLPVPSIRSSAAFDSTSPYSKRVSSSPGGRLHCTSPVSPSSTKGELAWWEGVASREQAEGGSLGSTVLGILKSKRNEEEALVRLFARHAQVGDGGDREMDFAALGRLVADLAAKAGGKPVDLEAFLWPDGMSRRHLSV